MFFDLEELILHILLQTGIKRISLVYSKLAPSFSMVYCLLFPSPLGRARWPLFLFLTLTKRDVRIND